MTERTATPVPLGHHLDEHDQPCTHHGHASLEALFAFATVGSRVSSFNHDIASKLQGLMMALDEISEIADGIQPEQRDQVLRATEGAQTCLKDLLVVLNTNRAMTKAPTRAPVSLAELTTRAGERVYVTLQGALPDVDVLVSAPTMIHALALVFDASGGPGRGRTVSVDAARTATHVTLSLPIASSSPSAPDLLALATFVFARDGGSLHCMDDGRRFVVALPIAS